MEDVLKPHNRGVLPENSNTVTESLQTQFPEEISSGGVIEAYVESTSEYRRDYSHVRSPELKRGEYVILMSATAVCGAVGGAILALSGKADVSALAKITQDLSGGFGSVFFQRLLIGAAFLLAEYIIGFFAFGDLFVWAAPMCCAMGLSLRIAATKSWILLPSAIITLIGCVMGAATSSGLSHTLIRLSRGGTVHLEDSIHVKYTVSFLGYLAAVLAGAIYEGAILN